MPILETPHQRKSAAITLLLLLLFLVGIFNFGMQYLDPPQEYGLAINFGDQDVGKGNIAKKTSTKPITPILPLPKETLDKKVVEEIPQKEVSKELAQEDRITQETTKDVPVIEKPEEVTKKPVQEPIKDSVQVTNQKLVEKAIPKEKPTPSKATQDALNNLLNNNNSDETPEGEGDDEIAGTKGKIQGDDTSSKYYGNTGSDGDENYNLAGRNPLSKPIQQPNCEEEGIVVVRIEVDKNGKVINAVAGVKGSTNTAACLLEPAKSAALKTVFNADSKAPSKQIGTIVYKFSLSE